jgi:hypothetical protein
MPATSKVQQKAAGAALSAKRGKTSKSRLQGASRGMYESMSEKELDKMASVKRSKLPGRKSSPKTRGRKSAARKSTARNSRSRSR